LLFHIKLSTLLLLAAVAAEVLSRVAVALVGIAVLFPVSHRAEVQVQNHHLVLL
jgi:hypothetical protein